MHFNFRNCNDAFRMLVNGFMNGGKYPADEVHHSKTVTNGGGWLRVAKVPSRVGDVLQIQEPVIVSYQQPLERVLFNEARDCNCFFHAMEAIWMLAGRNDVAPMAYYNSQIAGIASDDGKTFHGAYGYRWRQAFGGDQLDDVVQQFRQDPKSRRVVLSMWSPCNFIPTGDHGGIARDPYMAQSGGKDVPCNTHAYFLINNGKLDMTVCNRSNDLVWGMLGANVVHMSFLQEYLAAQVDVPVGVYNQMTNNLHVYTERFTPEKWLSDTTPDYYSTLPRLNYVPLVQDPERFEDELAKFSCDFLGKDLPDILQLGEAAYFVEPFFKLVAMPMAFAFSHHKQRNYKMALYWAGEIGADDWRRVCVAWLRKRQYNYEKAKDDGVNHITE